MYQQLSKEEKDELKHILLAPIIVNKETEGFMWSDDSKETIISGQKYEGDKDADMSDISICFYESLYDLRSANNKEGKILNGSGLFDKDFAGDTMNSLAAYTDDKNNIRDEVRNNILGFYKDEREAQEALKAIEEEIDKFSHKYHCLANFWLLPMVVGRGGGAFGKGRFTTYYDFMDNFLEAIMRKTYRQSNRYLKNETFIMKYPNYCNLFMKGSSFNWDAFASKHFINGIYLLKQNDIYYVASHSNLTDPIPTINSMDKMIELRADAIKNSKLAYRLHRRLTEELNK